MATQARVRLFLPKESYLASRLVRRAPERRPLLAAQVENVLQEEISQHGTFHALHHESVLRFSNNDTITFHQSSSWIV